MLPFKVLFDPSADLGLGAHVFPGEKYALIARWLRDEGIAVAADFVVPRRATDVELLRVHTAEYLEKVKTGTFTEFEAHTLEVPWSPTLAEAFLVAAGATVEASALARRDGCAVTLSGGFHHAFPDHGEGFCLIHDVAVAIEAQIASGAARRVAIVDLDVHQGNGSAAIFRERQDVFTGSVHQEWLYPSWKPPGTVDIGLPTGARDHAYLEAVDELLTLVRRFEPDSIYYVAGADPYEHDRLGGLKVTMQGLADRDERVFDTALELGVPVVVTLAGGYAEDTGDTVEIHGNTVRIAGRVFAK